MTCRLRLWIQPSDSSFIFDYFDYFSRVPFISCKICTVCVRSYLLMMSCSDLDKCVRVSRKLLKMIIILWLRTPASLTLLQYDNDRVTGINCVNLAAVISCNNYSSHNSDQLVQQSGPEQSVLVVARLGSLDMTNIIILFSPVWSRLIFSTQHTDHLTSHCSGHDHVLST